MNRINFKQEIEFVLKAIPLVKSVTYDCTVRNQCICFIICMDRSFKVYIYAENLKQSILVQNRCILIAESEYETIKMAKEYIDKIKQIYLVNPSRFYENVPTLTTKFECLIEIIDIDDKCKLQPDNFLSPGDYIRITRPDYHQYGIYIGNKKIIHDVPVGRNNLVTALLVTGVDSTGTAETLTTHETDWDTFVDGCVDKLSLIHHKIRVYSPTDIVERARAHQQASIDVASHTTRAEHCSPISPLLLSTNANQQASISDGSETASCNFVSLDIRDDHCSSNFNRPYRPPVPPKPHTVVTASSVDEAIRFTQYDEQKQIQPVRIIIAGASGVGKSTLINELFQVDTGCAEGIGAPVTMDIVEYPKPQATSNYDGHLRLVDTRGYEAQDYDVVKAIKKYITKHNKQTDASAHVHMALLCINGETRRHVPTDDNIIRLFAQFRIPTVIVLTRCYDDDTRDFENDIKLTFCGAKRDQFIDCIHAHCPFVSTKLAQLVQMVEAKYAEIGGKDEKIYNIDTAMQLIDCVSKSAYRATTHKQRKQNLQKLEYFKAEICKLFPFIIIVPIVARDKLVIHIDPTTRQTTQQLLPARGLDELNLVIMDQLDEAYRNAYAAAQMVDVRLKVQRAKLVVASFSAAAGGIGALPIPLTDALALVPLEIAMLSTITPIFHLQLNKGVLHAVAEAAIESALGHVLSSAAAKLFFPGMGHVYGGITAAALTLNLGNTYTEALAELLKNRHKHAPTLTTNDILKAMNINKYDDDTMPTDTHFYQHYHNGI